MDSSYQSILGAALTERLNQLGVFVLAVAVADKHVHLLGKMPHSLARQLVGLAKKHAWFEMRDAGWTDKLWAKGGKLDRVHNSRHQRNCIAYIVRHFHQCAWVWVWEGVSGDIVNRILDAR